MFRDDDNVADWNIAGYDPRGVTRAQGRNPETLPLKRNAEFGDDDDVFRWDIRSSSDPNVFSMAQGRNPEPPSRVKPKKKKKKTRTPTVKREEDVISSEDEREVQSSVSSRYGTRSSNKHLREIRLFLSNLSL